MSRTRDDSQGRLNQRLFSFTCDDCGRTYGSSVKLSRHRGDKHGPQISCYQCGKEFEQSRKWTLQTHTKTSQAKFQYRPHGPRYQGNNCNSGQHIDRRSECHQYKAVQHSRTKPTSTVTSALVTDPMLSGSDFLRSPESAMYLSGSIPAIRSHDIETFSFFDQNIVMNGFTNLSASESQSQLSTCKTVPLNSTTDLSDLINFDMPLTEDTTQSKSISEVSNPSKSATEDTNLSIATSQSPPPSLAFYPIKIYVV